MEYTEREKQESRELLAEWGIKPGAVIYTILRHVSRSGMMRVIAPIYFVGQNDQRYIYRHVARLVGYREDREKEGVRANGCGTDMGFDVVYNLSRALYPDGFGCIGTGCRSNDHSNGDRDYTIHTSARHSNLDDKDEATNRRNGVHWHRDGGYALQQRWL